MKTVVQKMTIGYCPNRKLIPGSVSHVYYRWAGVEGDPRGGAEDRRTLRQPRRQRRYRQDGGWHYVHDRRLVRAQVCREGQYFTIQFNIWFKVHYRPQHSCGKVMFLHLSVSHSVHRRGVVVYPSMHRGRHPPGQTDIPAYTGADTPLPTATAADGTHPTGMHSCLHWTNAKANFLSSIFIAVQCEH